MEPRIIKSRADYEGALSETERLVALDPEPGSKDANNLELLAMLVEQYEKKKFPVGLPEPLEAIRFRMEQLGLAQKDLVPFLGSPSKASEILAGKRKLTLSMIRALHEGLGIPAKVLLQEPDPPGDSSLDYQKFPIREMQRRGWISSFPKKGADLTAIVESFFQPIGGSSAVSAFFRGTLHKRSSKLSHEGLVAWLGQVLHKAMESPPEATFDRESVGDDFLTELVRLSWSERGPLLAAEWLNKHGIAFVVEPHLPRTLLDGAALLAPQGFPVVAVTIRHDRLDNFWFTVLHETVHVLRHIDSPGKSYFDDLELDADSDDELEADRLARDAAIPRSIWRRSDAYRRRTPEAIQVLAQQLKIHPAIVAGRIRYETRNFRLLHQLVGHGEVRCLFDSVDWGKGK